MNISTNWIDSEQYIKLLKNYSFKGASLFHHEDWLKVISLGLNAELKAVATSSKDNQIIALTPFMFKKKGPFKLFGAPLRGLYTEFTGSLFTEGVYEEMKYLALLSQSQFIKKTADYIEFGFENNKNEKINETFKNIGYEKVTRSSLIINLDLNKDELLKSYTGRARNMIRKSAKMNVEVFNVNPNIAWIKKYYSMLKDTFIRQGTRCPHPISFFYELINLHSSSKILFLEAKKDGNFIAGSLFLIDRKRMIYLSGTSNLEGMRTAATSALQHHAMLYGIENGYTRYDMGGLGIPSIDKFKLSFGGDIYYQDRWILKSKLFSLIEPIGKWVIKKGFIRL